MKRALLLVLVGLLALSTYTLAQTPGEVIPPATPASSSTPTPEVHLPLTSDTTDLPVEVAEAFSTSQLVGLALDLFLLFLALRLVDWFARWAARARPELGALLLGWMPPVRLVVAGIAFLLVLDVLIPENPTARAVVVLVLVMFVAWAAREVLQNAAAGAVLIARRAVRVGEYLRVGEEAGRVVSVSLRGVELQADDGSRVFLPGRRLHTDVATHAPGGGRAAPVIVTCPLPAGPGVPADRVQRLCRRLVILSPRRAPHSPVLVHVDGDVAHVTLTATPFDSAESGALEAELTRRVRETFAPTNRAEDAPGDKPES